MARNVSIAAVNFAVQPVDSFGGFAAHTERLLAGCRGADLVVYPELFTVELFTTLPGWQDLPIAELTRIDRYTDDYLELFTRLARRNGQHIVAGSHLVADGDRFLNVAHLFTPDGDVVKHAKTHIFPAEADWHTSEGDVLEAFDLPFARVGFNVCYEAEIPECAATLAEQGAEIILSPSYTFTEHGFWRVRHSAQARAVENQVYVVHCSTGGAPGAPLPLGWAQSSILSPCDAIFSPKGIVAEATANTEAVVRGIVDLDLLAINRETGAAPTYRDRRRRSDLYKTWPSHLSL
ncbi:carbon-nitrogen hydrolase family protein [Jiangella mangrovi]|uniref:Putative amidohydrolase n=1 Tax=Jiangella mangrovi TaxID=1524084 RepID=A0A7W9LJE7_9ACTN|nr:carbon-nitrogen hydrolase family protein [Jiangella mangrovi]MBB5785954.1 putative amidohydrolase [Jiangella mangrovi]